MANCCSFVPMRPWAVVALLLLLSALGKKSVVGGGRDAWDDDCMSLELLDGEAFKKVVNPLVEMAANAYRYPAIISIDGWTLVDAVAPVHGGMHALVYKDNFNTGRMVLSFRGTDSGTESAIADLCADEILWGETPFPVAYNCSQFSSETLDYYKQAVDYTRKVLKAHPQASLLLTGHSLGAGLAILMTATFSTNPLLPVIAFSAPGTEKVLEARSLKLTADHKKKLYIVADKWDEVMRTSSDNQVGTVCLFETTITKECTSCFEDEKTPSAGSLTDLCTHHGYNLHPQASGIIEVTSQQSKDPLERQPELEPIEDAPPYTADCLTCFFETHWLSHVIDLVELGNKPVCESQSLSEFHDVRRD